MTHFGAQRLQVQDLLAAHLVGHDQHDSVALVRADQREPQAGVAGGGLDDRAARLQLAVAARPPRSSSGRCGP